MPSQIDDVQAYTRCSPDAQDLAVFRLKICVQDLFAWTSSRRLLLNPAKTEFIWLDSPANLEKITHTSLDVLGSNIQASVTVRNLGVTLDPLSFFSEHVFKLSQVCFD